MTLKKLIVILSTVLPIFGNSKEINATPDNHNMGDYVILFHGIARSSSHMKKLASFLEAKGYEVYNLDYPSTSYELKILADKMDQKLKALLTKDKPVHLIGYSMGGILIRVLLNENPPKNLGRVVQLAPPNQGSEIADFLKENWLYQKIYGPAGQQLITNQEKVSDLFSPITYELGIIAGDFSIDPLSSYIIPGEDDGKVSVASTKLEGMKDHIIISASHTFFPSNKDVIKQTLNFLQNGAFIH